MKTKIYQIAKLTVLLVAVCLSMASMRASASLLTFEKLDPNGEFPIPNGYGHLMWDNFYTLNASSEENGYFNGMISSANVAYNNYGSPASISSQTIFIMNSAYLTGAWRNNMQVQVTGYLFGRKVYTQTYTTSCLMPTLVRFPHKLVNEVVFDSFGGTVYYSSTYQFVLDNLNVTP